jgi:hypothetical protein
MKLDRFEKELIEKNKFYIKPDKFDEIISFLEDGEYPNIKQTKEYSKAFASPNDYENVECILCDDNYLYFIAFNKLIEYIYYRTKIKNCGYDKELIKFFKNYFDREEEDYLSKHL